MNRRVTLTLFLGLCVLGLLAAGAVVPRLLGEEARAATGRPTELVADTRLTPAPPVESTLAQRAEAKAAEEQRVAAFLAAVAELYRPKTGVNWDAIARCETGGNWSMQGSRYSGGLGFYNGTWSSFGGREFAPNAGMATREQQIVVAERVYARYGLSGWGCKRFG